MWSDPTTGQTYTAAEVETMRGLPAYKKLVKRLQPATTAPEPVEAVAPKEGKKAKNGDKIFDSASGETDGN